MIALFRKVLWWLQGRRKEEELREELQFHLAEEMEERRADGLPDVEAAWAARRDLGNTTLLREDARTLWSWTLFEQLAQDVRYGRSRHVREPHVHRPGGPVPRAGDWRQHRDLQLHGRDPAALAAGGGSGVADRGEVAEPSGELRERGPVRDALHGGRTDQDSSGRSSRPSFRFPRSSVSATRRRRSCPASSHTGPLAA